MKHEQQQAKQAFMAKLTAELTRGNFPEAIKILVSDTQDKYALDDSDVAKLDSAINNYEQHERAKQQEERRTDADRYRFSVIPLSGYQKEFWEGSNRRKQAFLDQLENYRSDQQVDSFDHAKEAKEDMWDSFCTHLSYSYT